MGDEPVTDASASAGTDGAGSSLGATGGVQGTGSSDADIGTGGAVPATGGSGAGGAVLATGGMGAGGAGPAGAGGSGGRTTPDAAQANRCGNGVIEPGEACDDGNTLGEDGCTAICQIEDEYVCPQPGTPCVLLAVCGNGRVTASETCDDGNTVSGDGCSADCQVIESGWFCPVPGRRCRPICGDGKLVGNETCDDGNMLSGDGCSVRCQTEPGATCSAPGTFCKISVCGNGVREPGELCDCGVDPTYVPAGCTGVNGVLRGDGRTCTVTCVTEPNCLDSSGKAVTCPAICGDGKIDAQEQCDDGNLFDGDGCSSRCLLEAGFSCTAVVTASNTQRSACQSRCGDGVLTVDEECDDGAANSDQTYGGCTLACQPGFFCGDGIIESMEECDLGQRNGDVTLGAQGCTLACTRSRFCGDGIVSPLFGEECDLGALNGAAGQPCTATCRLNLL